MAPAKEHIHDLIPELIWLWKECLGDPDIRVAIIDGEVNKNHPALKEANLEILETHTGFSNGGRGISTEHGTHIASVIFGQHDSEVKGIAPHCKGFILPVFHDDASGNVTPCSQLDLARAITQATDAGAHVINISGGELDNSGKANPMLSKAIRQCAERNVLIVAAAGNDGCACLHIPGAVPSVLTVGGMDAKGNPLGFSNWGAAYRAQGILAPAENIPVALDGGQTALRSGTSFATAIVSGIAALLLSVQKKKGVQPDPAAVRNALLESADGCTDWETLECRRLLKGRMNIRGAYTKIQLDKIQTMEDLVPNRALALPSEQLSDQVNEKIANGVSLSGVEESPPTVLPIAAANLDNTIAPLPGVQPSSGGESCGCGNNKDARQPHIVFALGTLSYDLVSEARRDSLVQHMGGGNPNNPFDLLKYLEQHPFDSATVTWTLVQNATPIYAVMPYGAFAAEGYKRLCEFLGDQINSGADRISVPGIIAGQTRLMSGQVVPVIVPELRCMYNWNVAALLASVLGTPPASNAKEADKRAYEQRKSAVANFLERIYYELQNLGASPPDRAINYAATNALNAAGIFSEALKDNMQLDTIGVERSAVCRMDSDCWDVLLVFFDPEKQLVRARKAYRFTIDVSDVCPVMVGAVRSWFVR